MGDEHVPVLSGGYILSARFVGGYELVLELEDLGDPGFGLRFPWLFEDYFVERLMRQTLAWCRWRCGRGCPRTVLVAVGRVGSVVFVLRCVVEISYKVYALVHLPVVHCVFVHAQERVHVPS